jgi:hypothetical protein
MQGPPGFEKLSSDVPWDPAYLEFEPPDRIYTLDEFGAGAAGPNAFSPVAITTAFRFLRSDAIEILQDICAELKSSAQSSERIAKFVRGGVYRSEFLRGMSSDPTLIGWLRELAQAPLEAHPVSHHAVHINYAPDDLTRNVDQWHADIVSFDYVLMVSDPRPMKGGRFEYFFGPVEEGKALLEGDGQLPPERMRSADFPGPGWAVLQQGHRVLHRAARLEEPFDRVTIVGSFFTPHPDIDDPTASTLSRLRAVDGNEIALVEGSRYAAVAAIRKLEHFAETKADFARPLEKVRAELRASIADVERVLAEFDREPEPYVYDELTKREPVPAGQESSEPTR